MILIQPPVVQNWNSLVNKPSILSDNQISWNEIQNKPTTLTGYGITNGQPLGNELTALQSLSDTPGFLKKTGNGTYSIDVSNALALTGGTITGDLVSTSATVSTSPTTGAIRGASLGITGAIFAGTVSANSYNLIPIGRGGGSLSTNTVTGVSALRDNTTGSFLSAFGVNSLLANTMGIGSTAVGTGALQSNTTGNYSTAVGVSALLSNITGSSLTAAGLNALCSNTTGNNSSAFGVGALENNTTGNNLTASGVGALFSNITGSNLAGFGVGAGRYIADGITGLTVSNNSCFFGMNTKGTQNATNENVFGYNATGNGSNTVTIGDFNITNNFFRGALSLNATQVVSTRRTGWTAPTGTPTRTTFVTSTVTLTGLAERVKALIDDLITHGLIGA